MLDLVGIVQNLTRHELWSRLTQKGFDCLRNGDRRCARCTSSRCTQGNLNPCRSLDRAVSELPPLRVCVIMRAGRLILGRAPLCQYLPCEVEALAVALVGALDDAISLDAVREPWTCLRTSRAPAASSSCELRWSSPPEALSASAGAPKQARAPLPPHQSPAFS